MSVQMRWSLCALVLCGLVLEISSLARVDNRPFGRPANTTTPNQNHWQQPAWNASAAGNQWGGRPNQPAPGAHNSWPTYNQTQQYPGQQLPQQGWGTTPGNPWMRNNQTAGYYPQNPQQNNGWNARPNATHYASTPPAGHYNSSVGWGNSGFGQNSWKPPQQYPGAVNPQQPNYNNNSSAGWGNSGSTQNNWNNPQQYPGAVNPPYSSGWGANNTNNRATNPPTTNSQGWGSAGFGQGQFNNTQQYPGAGAAAAQNPNTGFDNSKLAGWNAPGNGPQQNNPQPQQGNAAFGAGWGTGSGAAQAYGGSAPLAPIGGGNNAWNGANTGTSGGAPAWNSNGQAGLSYPNNQPTGPGGQRQPLDNRHPYADLLHY